MWRRRISSSSSNSIILLMINVLLMLFILGHHVHDLSHCLMTFNPVVSKSCNNLESFLSQTLNMIIRIPIQIRSNFQNVQQSCAMSQSNGSDITRQIMNSRQYPLPHITAVIPIQPIILRRIPLIPRRGDQNTQQISRLTAQSPLVLVTRHRGNIPQRTGSMPPRTPHNHPRGAPNRQLLILQRHQLRQRVNQLHPFRHLHLILVLPRQIQNDTHRLAPRGDIARVSLRSRDDTRRVLTRSHDGE
mmetsp:Transcript_3652/g.4684  ORF Transcript_3652/g.4684 Transcript_3652/m.4684 type:complete len:245 (-) Transcript_3652:1562-2296(-)